MSNAVVPATPTSASSASVTSRLLRSENFMTNLIMLVVVLLLIGIGGMLAKAINRLPNAPIHIQQTGLNTAEYRELQRQLGGRAIGNFLQADLSSYINRLQKISWVDQVDIRRDWQQGLLVKVVPRQAVAKFGSERLVDANGVVYTPADSSELNAHYWMQLQGENQNAVVMMQQVKQISDWYLPLGLKVEEVIVTPRMTWLFRFNNGLRVLVDNEDTSEKLYRLSVMLQNQLHSQLPKIQTIDLRYKNGMAITWRSSIADAQDTSTSTAKPVQPSIDTTEKVTRLDGDTAMSTTENPTITNHRIRSTKTTTQTTVQTPAVTHSQ